MELNQENPFKIRALAAAPENLENLDESQLKAQINDKSLTQIKGVGKGVLAICQEFLKTGKSSEWDELTQKFPETLIEMRKIKGLGTKKIKKLYEELSISSLMELEYACVENRLAELKGFGKKSQDAILSEIKLLKSRANKLLLSDALEILEPLQKKIESNYRCFVVGDAGAKREIVERLELLVSAEARKKDTEKKNLDKILGKTSEKESKISFQHSSGQSIHIEFADLSKLASMAVWKTSSENHQRLLKKMAKKKKWQWHESALVDSEMKAVPAMTEEAVYEKLELPFHSPEMREFETVELKRLPELVEIEDIQGVFHAHSTFSDGAHSLEEMARAAQEKSWNYLGISEHSETAFYAGGLKVEDLQNQWSLIDSWNEKNSLQILKGIESDILKAGELDYSASTLKKFDFVIGSIHQRYGLKDMTERLLKAIQNPYLTIVGHISGRLLLGREAYFFNKEKVIREAIAAGVVIEFNSNPHRLDLDWRDLKEACDAGLITSLNPDAHSIVGYKDLQYGIWMARKAMISKKQILNTWSLKDCLRFFQRQREKKKAS